MAFSEQLATRVRSALPDAAHVEEKKMMGGLIFMVEGKMCVGVSKADLMVRLAPDRYDLALTRPECRAMEMAGKPMRNFVLVSAEGVKSEEDLALDYNKTAKPSRKRA